MCYTIYYRSEAKSKKLFTIKSSKPHIGQHMCRCHFVRLLKHIKFDIIISWRFWAVYLTRIIVAWDLMLLLILVVVFSDPTFSPTVAPNTNPYRGEYALTSWSKCLSTRGVYTYMANYATTVIHAWCFRFITCVKHNMYYTCICHTLLHMYFYKVYDIHLYYTCKHVYYMCSTHVLQMLYTCITSVWITCVKHQNAMHVFHMYQTTDMLVDHAPLPETSIPIVLLIYWGKCPTARGENLYLTTNILEQMPHCQRWVFLL